MKGQPAQYGVTFKYDPFGKRIEKISPAATSIFAYDGDPYDDDDLVEVVNSSGGLVARYSQGQDIDEPLAMQQGGTTDYYEADGLGSITSLTATNGSLAQSYAYDSFGNSTNSTGSVTNFFRYTAREFDTEAGLYYYRARYYDPASGRFASEDPLGSNVGTNRYSYTTNSPVNLIDPSGLCPKCPPSSLFSLSPTEYEELGRTAGWISNDLNLFNFRRGAALDAQRNGPFTAYANYAFGVYACGAGYSLSTALNLANTYAYLRSTYHNVPMDLKYKHTPVENVVNITLGFSDCRNGTLCKQ